MIGISRRRASIAMTLAATSLLGACATTVDKIKHIGEPPGLSPIAVQPNMAAGAPVYLPQPANEYQPPQANSLWQVGSRSFFRDPRAAKVGDLLTVQIAIGDQAKIANTT